MSYSSDQPKLADIEAHIGAMVLEFGTNWCGICQTAAPTIARGLAAGGFEYVKVEDGQGRRLGRAFLIKLWPTLIFLRDGHEVERLVRPTDAVAVAASLARITCI